MFGWPAEYARARARCKTSKKKEEKENYSTSDALYEESMSEYARPQRNTTLEIIKI